MKKHVFVVVFLATLSSAIAIPTFVLPDQIDIEPGQSVTVTLEATNLADFMTRMGSGIQNMNVFLSCDAPLVLSDLDLVGEGLLFSAGYDEVYVDNDGDQILMGWVETSGDPYTESGPVARFMITAPLDIEQGFYGLSTIALRFSILGNDGETGQAYATINIVPEPASALLLLAGLPLLRRRHA